MYPNLNIKRSAKECGREIEDTEVEYENVDYKWAGRFIASNMNQDEIYREGLNNIVPRRKNGFGTRPGATTKELYDKREYDKVGGKEIEKESKWREVRRVLSRKEKRKLLRKVLEISITTLMRNHIYQFEGKTRVQREGGSIGMAATGVIARIRMMRWTRRFREICKINRLELLVFKVYVDDENQMWRIMERGRRWNGSRLEWR